jgi:hypothetical protein
MYHGIQSHGFSNEGRGAGRLIPIVMLFISLLIPSSGSISQTLDPPYPRLGIFTFSGLTYASLDILKDFDVITIGPNEAPSNDMARQYKAQNPNLVLLANATRLMTYRSAGILPEPWYLHDYTGKRFTLWDGAWIMNFTKYCPKVDQGDGLGPVTYIEWAMNWLQKRVDWNNFNGVFHDWWWGRLLNAQNQIVDFDNNGIADQNEWGGADSVRAVWTRGLQDYHSREYQIPGCKYVVVQVGYAGFWPNINGACFEDWPLYNGPFIDWMTHYTDKYLPTKQPRIMLFDNSHRFANTYGTPVTPYKNNYRSVRYGLSSCLLMSGYFFVDEGNVLGHHGNVHIYDEFEAKGQLGYPRTDPIKLSGKLLASTPYASGIWVRFFDHGVSIVNATGIPQTITASELAVIDPAGGSRYYRFQGGQDPNFNNGRELTDSDPILLWGDAKMANTLFPEVLGDGCMLFRTRKVLVTPIVVDNHVNNQTSPGSDPVGYTGGWVLSSEGQKFYAFYTGRNYAQFQPDGFAWSPPGQGENVAAYVPTIGLSGLYEVYEWHGYRGIASTAYPLAPDAPVTITSARGDTSFTINQTRNFGQWNSLGIYPFEKGKTGKVVLTNKTNGIVISDAVRYVYRGATGGLDTTPPAPPQGVRVNRLN